MKSGEMELCQILYYLKNCNAMGEILLLLQFLWQFKYDTSHNRRSRPYVCMEVVMPAPFLMGTGLKERT